MNLWILTQSVKGVGTEGGRIWLISTSLHATTNTASLPIIAKCMVANTQPEVTPNQQPSNFLLDIHQPWTPRRSFLLECELSSHLDKSFVKQLIHSNLPIWQTTYPLHISCIVPLMQHLRTSMKLDVFWDLFRLLHWKTFIPQDLVRIYCTNYQT